MAYQGKFSQPRSTEENLRPNAELQQKEPAAPQAAPEKKSEPRKAAEPVKKAAEPAKKPVPAPQAEPDRKQAPAKKSGKKKKKKKKANRTITIIFYTVYFVMVAAILAGMFFLNGWLEDWLVSYEASRPTTRCQEVFDEYFADPNWAELYDLAGIADTPYEGAEAFASVMVQKVGLQELSFVETSAGLSGGHKYLVKLGEETLGYFTLVDNAPQGAEIPDWQLGEISLNHSYPKSVTIQKMDDLTVYVNGVALTDDHTIQIGTTAVEKYLEDGLHGPRIYTQYLEGLMCEPTVTATDAEGNSVEVSYNTEAGMYVVQTESNTISTEEYDRVVATAKTYALRMIEMASANELAKYFDSSSQIYNTIVKIDPWMQEWFFSSYEWGQESVTGYFRHSDKLFSVHVDLTMHVTRTDGSVKEYVVDHSFFFEKQGGTWKCVNMINVDIQEQTASVRLTFKSGDAVIFTNLYADDTTTLNPPVVSAPEGQVFAGWYLLTTAADGTPEYTLVFTPDENGVVTLPMGNKLEPMTLYALFENAQ